MKSFTSCDSVTHEGESNIWFTPKSILDKLGSFDLDPCSSSFRPFDIANRHYCLDRGHDGLQFSWEGRVFMNPPYGKSTGAWLDKLCKHNNGIALVFASFETSWGQRHLRLADGVFIIKGRVSFIREDLSKSNNAGKGSCLFIYGRENLFFFENECKLNGVLLKVNEGGHVS